MIATKMRQTLGNPDEQIPLPAWGMTRARKAVAGAGHPSISAGECAPHV